MFYNDEDFEVTTRNELFEEMKKFYFNRMSEVIVARYYSKTDIEYKNRLANYSNILNNIKEWKEEE